MVCIVLWFFIHIISIILIIEYTTGAATIVENDVLARSISKWIPSSAEGTQKKLNGGQMVAMNKAIYKTFQLIQGPPGIVFLLGPNIYPCMIGNGAYNPIL